MKRSFVMFSIALVSLGIPAMLLAYSLSGATDHQTSGPLSDEQMAKIFGGTDCEEATPEGCNTVSSGNLDDMCGGIKEFEFEYVQLPGETLQGLSERYLQACKENGCNLSIDADLLGESSASGSDRKSLMNDSGEQVVSECDCIWVCQSSGFADSSREVDGKCVFLDDYEHWHCASCSKGNRNCKSVPLYFCPNDE